MNNLDEMKQAYEKLGNQVKDISNKMNELSEAIKKAEEEESGLWKPAYKEDYLIITITGEISTWTNTESNADKRMIDSCKCYKLSERLIAEKDAEQEQVLALLRQWARKLNGDWVPDWDDSSQSKFVMYIEKKKVIITYYGYSNFGVPAFKTEELHRKAIEKIGEERIIKAFS